MSDRPEVSRIQPHLRRLCHGAFVLLMAAVFALATLPMSDDAFAKSRKKGKSAKASQSRVLARKSKKLKAKPALQKPAKDETETAKSAKPTPIPVDAPQKLALESGNVRAILLPETAGARISPGASAFTSIMVTGSGKVDLLAEVDGGEIADLSGDGAQTETAGRTRRLTGNLDNGPLQLLLELRAGADGTLIAGKPHNRIRLTLKSDGAGAAPDSSVLSWEVADCSRDYYAELEAIRDERDSVMANAIDTILSGDETLPGTWLFAKPTASMATPAQIAEKQCKTWAKRNDAITGEKVRRCVVPKKNAEATATLISTAAQSDVMPMGEVVALADRFVADQLASTAFEKKKVLRIISFQLLGSLRIFLSQKHHPALCTGTDAMLDYYIENSSPLSNSTTRLRLAADSAALHAGAAIGRLLPDTAAKGAGGTADVNSASLETPAVAVVGNTPPSLRKLIGTVARSVLSPTDAALVDEPDTLVALQRFRMILDLQIEELATTGAVAGSRIDAAREALGMVEAAAYLAKAAERFEQMSDASFGTAERIRAAHRKTCTCGN